jgi:hypothetical protein
MSIPRPNTPRVIVPMAMASAALLKCTNEVLANGLCDRSVLLIYELRAHMEEVLAAIDRVEKFYPNKANAGHTREELRNGTTG